MLKDVSHEIVSCYLKDQQQLASHILICGDTQRWVYEKYEHLISGEDFSEGFDQSLLGTCRWFCITW